jgi:hypothetical protein
MSFTAAYLGEVPCCVTEPSVVEVVLLVLPVPEEWQEEWGRVHVTLMGKDPSVYHETMDHSIRTGRKPFTAMVVMAEDDGRR